MKYFGFAYRLCFDELAFTISQWLAAIFVESFFFGDTF
jgi:hypothetical protein